MIIEIFIPQGHCLNSLADQLLQGVLDIAWIPGIIKTLGRSATHSYAEINLTQKQASPVATQVTSAEIRHHFSGAQILKL